MINFKYYVTICSSRNLFNFPNCSRSKEGENNENESNDDEDEDDDDDDEDDTDDDEENADDPDEIIQVYIV